MTTKPEAILCYTHVIFDIFVLFNYEMVLERHMLNIREKMP